MASALDLLINHVRGTTLDFVEGVPDNWLTWSPPGTSNHLLWHAGHALWVQEVLTLEPLTGENALPVGWAAKFGEGCPSPNKTTDWPTRQELIDLLRSQQQRALDAIVEHVDRLTTADPNVCLGHGWPLLEGVVHGWHDEARHQGEMYLLFKLQRAADRPA